MQFAGRGAGRNRGAPYLVGRGRATVVGAACGEEGRRVGGGERHQLGKLGPPSEVATPPPRPPDPQIGWLF